MTETVVVVVALTLALLVTAAVPALGVVEAVGEGPDDACCLSGDK